MNSLAPMFKIEWFLSQVANDLEIKEDVLRGLKEKQERELEGREGEVWVNVRKAFRIYRASMPEKM